MYRNKRKYVDKGYIIVYTLLVCSILVIMSLLIYTLEVKRFTNVQSYERYVEKNIKQEDYKEYLLTSLYSDLDAHVVNMSYSSVRNYLSSSNICFKSEDSIASIKYDSLNSKINLDTPYDSNYFRRDLYDYKIINGRLRFIFLKTSYIQGRIQ